MVLLFFALTVSELLLIFVYKVVAHYAENAFYSQIGDPFILWGINMEPGLGIYSNPSEKFHDPKKRNLKIQGALKPIIYQHPRSQICHETVSQANDSKEKELTSNTFCPICLNDYEDGEEIARIKNCSHDFHRQCIKIWLQRNDTCPCCRCNALKCHCI